jgi:hypothetical protein
MKGCHNYEILGLIFNPSKATGILRHFSARTPPNSNEEEELNEALLQFRIYVNQGGHIDGSNGDGNVGDSVGGCSNGGNQSGRHSNGMAVGGNVRGKLFVDRSASNLEFKRKGKINDLSSIDSLRSDALKEFIKVSCLKRSCCRKINGE